MSDPLRWTDGFTKRCEETRNSHFQVVHSITQVLPIVKRTFFSEYHQLNDLSLNHAMNMSSGLLTNGLGGVPVNERRNAPPNDSDVGGSGHTT